MTPVAEEILQHLHSRITQIAAPVKVKVIDDPLVAEQHTERCVFVEFVDDALEEERSSLGVHGAVGMALEIDVAVFALSSEDASLEARTLASTINAALVSGHGAAITGAGARYRVETAGDDPEGDGDGQGKAHVIRTQYSVLYRYRRSNPAQAA